jgi:diguanylate cyclase
MSDKKPFEIAREALKQITARQLAPTPVNYQAIYNEIAGLPNVQPFPEEPLRQIAQALPTRNPGQEKQRTDRKFKRMRPSMARVWGFETRLTQAV